MNGLRAGPAVVLISLAFVASPLAAQVPVVVHGRVEDASSRAPVAGARVISADSSTSVLTDSLGSFTLPLDDRGELAVHVERIGYLPQRFDLPEEAPFRVSVLLLEPTAIELEGVTVVSEAAIETLVDNLEHRRNAYSGSMRAYDQAWLERFAPIGSIFELVRRRIPGMFPCESDPGQMCIRGRGPTFSNPFPTDRLTVCLDGRKSIAPIGELDMLPVESVALVEFYGRSGVKVYTTSWIVSRARTGWTTVMPDSPFGLEC